MKFGAAAADVYALQSSIAEETVNTRGVAVTRGGRNRSLLDGILFDFLGPVFAKHSGLQKFLITLAGTMQYDDLLQRRVQRGLPCIEVSILWG